MATRHGAALLADVEEVCAARGFLLTARIDRPSRSFGRGVQLYRTVYYSSGHTRVGFERVIEPIIPLKLANPSTASGPGAGPLGLLVCVILSRCDVLMGASGGGDRGWGGVAPGDHLHTPPSTGTLNLILFRYLADSQCWTELARSGNSLRENLHKIKI